MSERILSRTDLARGRHGYAIVETIPDGVSEIVTAVHGVVRFAANEPVNDTNNPIAHRLLTGEATLEDYAHAREHGWEIELRQ